MRRSCLLIVCAGCRTILGIDDPHQQDQDAVGGEAGTEMPPEATAGVDAPIGCRADFNALPNSGPRGHRYKLLLTADDFQTQRSVCAAIPSWLAFPDGANAQDAQLELAAIVQLGGPSTWVGIDDLAQEGSTTTSLGAPTSAATTALIMMSGNSSLKDCFLAMSSSSIQDDDCNANRKAVCECIP